MRSIIQLCLLFTGLLLAQPGVAGTYFVNAEGTGDYPDIQAAVDASVDGDSIILGDGWYPQTEEHGVYIKIRGTPSIIRGCTIRGNSTPGYGGGISAILGTEIDSCVVSGNSAGMAGGGLWFYPANVDQEMSIRSCTIAGNSAPLGAGISNQRTNPNVPAPLLTIDRSIIAFNLPSQALYCPYPDEPVAATCTDIYGNGADWSGCIAGQDGVNGNFSLNPRFCAPYAGNSALDMESPCLPENNGCLVQIGARGFGCDLTAAMPGEARPIAGVYNAPNPFNPATEIVFSLADAERVTIRIFDSRGHLVRDLATGRRFPPGAHRVHWEGRDDNGQPLPPASTTAVWRSETRSAAPK